MIASLVTPTSALPPPLPPVSAGVVGSVVGGSGKVDSSPHPTVTPVASPPGPSGRVGGVGSTPGEVGDSSHEFAHSVTTPVASGGRSRPCVTSVPVPVVHGSRVSLSSGASRPLFSLEQVGELARCFVNCDRDLFRYLSSYMVTDLVDNHGYSLRELLAAHIFVVQYYEMSGSASSEPDSL
jgi:hypothetical protein